MRFPEEKKNMLYGNIRKGEKLSKESKASFRNRGEPWKSDWTFDDPTKLKVSKARRFDKKNSGGICFEAFHQNIISSLAIFD